LIKKKSFTMTAIYAAKPDLTCHFCHLENNNLFKKTFATYSFFRETQCISSDSVTRLKEF